ncbi:MAG: Obg family GTPase CgtA [Candidatus Pelagibacterales bacterium]|jgi:GTP-binding protein
MKFIDEAKVFIKSGDGGDGCLSFRREKYIEFGGPDGGNGGRGGNIYVQGVKGLNTLVDFRFQKHFRAKKGVHGAGRKRNGAAGKDIVLKLPLGTQIYEDDELIEDIVSIKKILLFEGGKGGLGNTNFKSSTNRAPRKITLGEKGYEADVVFKLKLIADTGLIGLPNAGKSSFMKKLTAAKTKVGDYPFTTIVPKLGVMRKGDSEKIIADIPGLIEGAHTGTGLGFQFLRHIERCTSIIHILDVAEKNVVSNYKTIRNELKSYNVDLKNKPEIVVLNKSDLLENEDIKKVKKSLMKITKNKIYIISTITNDGIDELKEVILRMGL